VEVAGDEESDLGLQRADLGLQWPERARYRAYTSSGRHGRSFV
jgi:hypothetical protein